MFFLGGTLGKNSSGSRGITKLKEFICLHDSKLNKTRAGVFGTRSKGLFKEMVLSPETQMSLCTQIWLFDGPHTDRVYRKKFFIMVFQGVGIIGSTDWFGPGYRAVDH